MNTELLKTEPFPVGIQKLRESTSDSALDQQIETLKSTLNADDNHPTVAAMIACKTEREAGARREIADAIIAIGREHGIQLEHPVGPEAVKDMALAFGITSEDLKEHRRKLVFEYVANTPGGASIKQVAKELAIQAMSARGDLTELVTSKQLELDSNGRYVAPISS